jgi:hypothetical protein
MNNNGRTALHSQWAPGFIIHTSTQPNQSDALQNHKPLVEVHQSHALVFKITIHRNYQEQ